MDPLEKYYNEEFNKNKCCPAFNRLSDDDKRTIAKSLGFAIFNLHNSINEFFNQLRKYAKTR